MKKSLGLAIGAALLIAMAAPTPALASPSNGPAGTSEFRGVNWADPRDNYAHDEVVPSGLSTADDYRTTYAKASDVVLEFRHELKANTVRLPINPSSVGTDWWDSYQGAIDAAVRHGFKVILSYWEADNAKDGRVDSPPAFDAMWDTVVAKYGKNPHVYFEIMNEPFGYTLDEWVTVASDWLDDHDQIPRERVIVSGTGYNDNVTGVGAAKALDGTLLSLHFYGFWASSTTEAEWKANLLPRIGEYGWRTLISEAGSPMTTGLNYGNHEGDVYTSYLGALTEVARDQGMGLVYWPGLRTGDAYTLTELASDGNLEVTNESGLAQIQWGWGILKKEQLNDLPPAPPGEPLVSVKHGVCIDVPGFSTTPGTTLGIVVLQRWREPVIQLDARKAAVRLRAHVRDSGRRSHRGQCTDDRRVHRRNRPAVGDEQRPDDQQCRGSEPVLVNSAGPVGRSACDVRPRRPDAAVDPRLADGLRRCALAFHGGRARNAALAAEEDATPTRAPSRTIVFAGVLSQFLVTVGFEPTTSKSGSFSTPHSPGFAQPGPLGWVRS